MKLLFDENLSHHLVALLCDIFPSSSHVRLVGLERVADREVWLYARKNGFAIVTRDADFHERSLLEGHPPKVIWIRRGNCSTSLIAQILRANHALIEHFADQDALSTFVLH